MTVRTPSPPDSERLAKARERFLTADPVVPRDVRRTILASWHRSRQWRVPADHVQLPYVRDPDLDTPFTRTALPVLRKLHESLGGQPVSVILTDPSAVVLSRMTCDRDLERHLDGVKLAPGFSYAEEHVGTNGIGTALEGRQPAHVFGHEHYAEYLEDLACAGVPIHDPVSGKTLGAIDLTCWRKHADYLLVALAKTTASQITQALLTNAGAREVQVLQEYLRACRRTSGIVIAFSHNVVMMNDRARQVLDPADQAALIGHASEALTGPHARVETLELPSGVRARMRCRPITGAGRLTGGIVAVKLARTAWRPAAVPAGSTAMCLPGLVGCGPLWLRGCHEVEAVYERGEWLALEGEPGVGKLAVLRAVHQRRSPAGRFHVLDAAEATGQDWLVTARRELLDNEGTLVIRHVDVLGARQLHALSAALQEARAAGRQQSLWVAVTLDRRREGTDLTRLMRFFPSTAELPPLRHHIEDLHALVPFFLAKLSHQARLTCSAAAMRLLVRSKWPGNARQLWQVLKGIARQRRTGSIQPTDLPPECWTVSRRLLSPLESMQRDAIVASLRDHGGNKVRAAEALGMSRATIYRKIREYAIVTPTA